MSLTSLNKLTSLSSRTRAAKGVNACSSLTADLTTIQTSRCVPEAEMFTIVSVLISGRYFKL